MKKPKIPREPQSTNCAHVWYYFERGGIRIVAEARDGKTHQHLISSRKIRSLYERAS